MPEPSLALASSYIREHHGRAEYEIRHDLLL
jgi:hypothetical protein